MGISHLAVEKKPSECGEIAPKRGHVADTNLHGSI